MTEHTQTIAETDATNDGAEPEFVMTTFPDGTITISVEGFGKDVDGLPIMTFTQFGGVEIGQSTIFAVSGEPSYCVFEGSFAEQKQFFDRWIDMAEANTRPLVYRDAGITALVNMGRVACPSTPQVDIEGSEHMKQIAQISRELATEYEAKLGRNLIEKDFLDTVKAVVTTANQIRH